MADTAVASAPAVTTPSKKGKGAAGAKKPKAKPTHPKTSDMVNHAIGELKERGGSSLQAIKKYIGANYKVDADKLAPFIRRYLKSAVESGKLVHTKGKGASGSFKLDVKTKTAAPKKEAGVAKKRGPKPAPKKAGVVKKRAAPKKSKAVKAAKPAASPKKAKPAKAKKPKTPTKAKKTTKPPTKKPKSPKPKKAVAAKSKAVKKPAKK